MIDDEASANKMFVTYYWAPARGHESYYGVWIETKYLPEMDRQRSKRS